MFYGIEKKSHIFRSTFQIHLCKKKSWYADTRHGQRLQSITEIENNQYSLSALNQNSMHTQKEKTVENCFWLFVAQIRLVQIKEATTPSLFNIHICDIGLPMTQLSKLWRNVNTIQIKLHVLCKRMFLNISIGISIGIIKTISVKKENSRKSRKQSNYFYSMHLTGSMCEN